ncbi:MAG: hypothetical protein ACLR8P_07000 [Clostridium fessum]
MHPRRRNIFGNLIDGAGDDVELGFLGERGAAFEEELGEIEAIFRR